MTDNRTTELESMSKLKMAGRLRYWRGTIEISETELHAICDEIQAEHEQAIAATLGSGTLTAEQVRETVEGHGNIMDNRLYEDWQAVADELNAELGSGTCAMIPSFTKPVTLDDCQEFCCSACGEYMVIQQFPGWVDEVPNFCPNCGKAVER